MTDLGSIFKMQSQSRVPTQPQSYSSLRHPATMPVSAGSHHSSIRRNGN